MGGVIGEKVGMGRDGPELNPPESTNPATGLSTGSLSEFKLCSIICNCLHDCTPQYIILVRTEPSQVWVNYNATWDYAINCVFNSHQDDKCICAESKKYHL